MPTNPENFALIIGARFHCTTSLFNYLSQHPEICACQKKIIIFLHLIYGRIDASFNFEGLGKVRNKTVVESPLLYAIKSNKKLHNFILSTFPRNLRMLVTSPMKSTKAKDKFKLSPEQREFVLSELKEDLKKLKDKYGVNIERWNLEV